MSNFKHRVMELGRHFTIIDSPIEFWLVANPFVSPSVDIGVGGTDRCFRMAGAWQLDNWKLLPKDWMKNNPAFNMWLVWDEEKLQESGGTIEIQTSDLDIGDGVAGVNGQDVFITGTARPIPINWELTPFNDLMSGEEVEGKTNLESLRKLSSRLNTLFEDFLWAGDIYDYQFSDLDDSNSNLSEILRAIGALLYRITNYDSSFKDFLADISSETDIKNETAHDIIRWSLKMAADNHKIINSRYRTKERFTQQSIDEFQIGDVVFFNGRLQFYSTVTKTTESIFVASEFIVVGKYDDRIHLAPLTPLDTSMSPLKDVLAVKFNSSELRFNLTFEDYSTAQNNVFFPDYFLRKS